MRALLLPPLYFCNILIRYRKKALALHPHRKDAGKENAQGTAKAFVDVSQVRQAASTRCPRDLNRGLGFDFVVLCVGQHAFSSAGQAFDVLSDLQSRAAYDKDSIGFTKASAEYTLDAALALFERFFSTVSNRVKLRISAICTLIYNPFPLSIPRFMRHAPRAIRSLLWTQASRARSRLGLLWHRILFIEPN